MKNILVRKHILDRIENIKSDEENFKSFWWKNNYVSYSKWVRKTPHIPIDMCEEFTKHISEADFDNMNDDDLVRLFEYIILTRSDIITRRVKTFLRDNFDVEK